MRSKSHQKVVPKNVLFLVTFWTNFGAILGPEIHPKSCPKLDQFLEEHDSGFGGGASDHPAFYAGVVFGFAIQRICPTKERGGYRVHFQREP